MLDVRRLALVRELDARGSLAEVSRALGISSSAISQQLGKPEAEAGLQLLEPVGRTVQLTPAAKLLARRADEIAEVLERAEAELEHRRSRVQGVVRFAAFSTFALRYLPEVLRRTAASHPDVVVEFTQVEALEALAAVAGRRADIAVTDEYPRIPRRVEGGMTRIRLLEDPLAVYTPGPVDSIEALQELQWVLEPEGSDACTWAHRVCREAGFEPRLRFESPDLRVHHALVAAGEAAAFLPSMVFSGPWASLAEPAHRFAWPIEDDGELHRDVYAVTRRGGELRPAVGAVLQHLRDVTGD